MNKRIDIHDPNVTLSSSIADLGTIRPTPRSTGQAYEAAKAEAMKLPPSKRAAELARLEKRFGDYFASRNK